MQIMRPQTGQNVCILMEGGIHFADDHSKVFCSGGDPLICILALYYDSTRGDL